MFMQVTLFHAFVLTLMSLSDIDKVQGGDGLTKMIH